MIPWAVYLRIHSVRYLLIITEQSYNKLCLEDAKWIDVEKIQHTVL